MRTTITALLVGLAATALVGCSDGARSATDGAGASPAPTASASAGPMPAEVPAADGPVRTRDLAIVMDRGDGPPELCLGPVAESYPPQCGGPPIEGWDWSVEQRHHEQQGRVRWGSFSVTGTWDGETFTVTDAVPAALYSPVAPGETVPPTPQQQYSEAELAAIAEEVGAGLGGAQGAYAGEGHVFVDVTCDDGSLQAWADRRYGQDVVLVASALLDVPG
jgi:hypothetical protein